MAEMFGASASRGCAPALDPRALSLTQHELTALPAIHNLSDGHADRRWSAAERDAFDRVVRRAHLTDRRQQWRLEGEYVSEYFRLARQTRPANMSTHFFFTASMALEAIGNHLRTNNMSIALIEPCFDNLSDILRRHGVRTTALPETAFASDLEALDRALPLAVDAVLIVTPNNPTGLTVSRDHFAHLVEFCAKTQKLLIIDACFRFYTRDEQVFDQYALLDEAGIDYLVIEDTGKTWPTLELKAPFLSASRGMTPSISVIRSDFLLHISPLCVELMIEFVRTSQLDNLRAVRAPVLANRSILERALNDTFLRPADTGLLSLAWLTIDAPLSAVELSQKLAEAGVHVLAGDRFFWSQPHKGDSFIRVALVRDEVAFRAAVERLRVVCGEVLEVR